jgi:hypothetical protein
MKFYYAHFLPITFHATTCALFANIMIEYANKSFARKDEGKILNITTYAPIYIHSINCINTDKITMFKPSSFSSVCEVFDGKSLKTTGKMILFSFSQDYRNILSPFLGMYTKKVQNYDENNL